MIREIRSDLVTGELRRKEYACNSTDTKPTEDITNGSVCIEVDTGDVYLFNEATSLWVKM